ncbi:hypothetical protein DC366_18920 [Pelagivirga sediminicola]|uniref:Uncharacterized protein n=1 Tax=Pelagivirga sediminicola TaxID=2170575 RepID=A0A2T7G252_9RHOB|nr:hypothetical protein DC366_18920 [Pelagivirga sediminicola]
MITFGDGGQAHCTGMEVDLLTPSSQAADFLAQQSRSQEYGPAELGQTDKQVSPPHEAQPECRLHDACDIEEPDLDETGGDLSL